MNNDIDESNRLLRLHLKASNVANTTCWTLSSSPIGGRGLFATRDLLPGDLVFVDAPLVVGPRVCNQSQYICVGCHRTSAALVACSRGCGLPVCDVKCEESDRHAEECARLLGWRQKKKKNAGSWSPDLVKALTPIRCLSLDDDQRSLVRCLEAHRGPLHEREIDLLKKHVDVAPSMADEEFMRLCCCAMDANAFEIAARIESDDADVAPTQTSLRGLFPLSAMMNHACTPNTRHGYNQELRMYVVASVAIPQGTEITTSYFALMWGTTARRHHLYKTKHFLCYCARCRDPLEGGTRLSALKCALPQCPGCLLSEDPVKPGSKWVCDHCGVRLPEKETLLIQSGLGTMMRVINCDDPVQVKSFLRGHQRLFASSNQVIVELKSCLVWVLGHFPGYHWQDLTDADLAMKEELCRELLEILQQLKAGQCRLRALFLFELHCTLVEQQRRLPTNNQMKLGEATACIEEAASMFLYDVTAPDDLRRRLEVSRSSNTNN